MAKDNRITVRLTGFERQAIELLVKQKAYADITEFTRKAIQEQLKAEGMTAKYWAGQWAESPQETEGSGAQ